MRTLIRAALAAVALACAAQASAQITFYERAGFEGRSFTAHGQVDSFKRLGFNDDASSVDVLRDRWEVCEGKRFSGRCVVLRPGRYLSLAAMGMNNRVSSVRIVPSGTHIDARRYGPPPATVNAYYRRQNERLYEADVVSVRAMFGPAEQRCWIEPGQVVQQQSNVNLPGAIAGAVIGGILGHQVGGGRGNDIATAGGAVVGAAVGANVGRDGGGQQVVTQDVRRCVTEPGPARPEYWDVTYSFRGQEHRMQTTVPPGPTVTVNGSGEPRA